MTEPPLDIDAIRKRHALGPRGWPVYCADCEGKNSCVVRLCDEVERLRRVECVHLWYLTGTPTNHAIHCVNCGATTDPTADPANDSAVH